MYNKVITIIFTCILTIAFTGCSPLRVPPKTSANAVEIGLFTNNTRATKIHSVTLLNDKGYNIVSSSYDTKTKVIVAAGIKEQNFNLIVYKKGSQTPQILANPVIPGTSLHVAPALVYAYGGKALVIGANALFTKDQHIRTVAYELNLDNGKVIKTFFFRNLVRAMSGNGYGVLLTCISKDEKNSLLKFDMNSLKTTTLLDNKFDVPWFGQYYRGRVYGLGISKNPTGGISAAPTHLDSWSPGRSAVNNILRLNGYGIAFAFHDGVAYVGVAGKNDIQAFNVTTYKKSFIATVGNPENIKIYGSRLYVVTNEGFQVIDITTKKSVLFMPMSNAGEFVLFKW